ncbi:hypothetical protein M3Y94_00909800 [Aphelenchoides besseyi]|nr:hypothetical protein M3Y94_00909800 [Aphelenchoides besseyi]
MSSIVETKPMMNVELFAAEIGSESALKKLNEYARSLTHQHLKDVDDFEQSIEARDTVHVESSSDWIDKVEASGDSMMRSLVRMRQELRKTTPPKSAEYKKPNYRMINYVNGLTENSLLQTTLQNLGHQKPLDLCVDEGTLILCQPDFLPYGLIAPEVKLLTIKERQFLCRYHSFQALKFRNSKYNEERSAYQALEWKHLLVMLKILNDHNLMSCTEDLGVTPEELEWSSERLVFLTHEIKSRNAICSLISINENKIQVVMDYCVKEHDYTTENVDSSLTYLTLLYHCYCTKGNYKEMFSTILRISKILLDDSIERTSTLMPTFCFCLKQLDLHLKTFLALPDVTHKKLAKLLSLFTDKSLYRTVAPLWMLCYRLTVIESKETVEEFEEHFDRAKQAANFLPTRGLMLLREGHEVMADENCCMADQGVFIRYYLKQLNRCVKLEAYEEALTCFVSGMATELKQNVENEIIQGVMCLHNLTINTRKQRIRSHSTGEQKPIEWLTLELILPLLVPEKMPNFDDKQVLKMELIDLIRQSTNLLMKPINDELKNRFDQFVRDHYSYNLEFAIDTNGHMSNADSVHCGQSMFDWPSVAANELTESQRKLSATAMYLMTFHLYRQTQEEAVGVARTVLMFGRHSLSDELLSSTWMIVAKANTRIVLYEDRKLFAHMDEMLFPFRMALLLRKNVAEAHLDVGILMYQCHARIRRFIRTDSSDQLVPNLKKQAFRLLSSCKVHFQLAELYKTQATDIMWLIQYFLGKVSEKFDQPIETVLQHYGECAKRMQSDKYTFPAKISRKTQHNFEPLELFYRVHKYLNFKRTVALKHNDLCTMQKIVAALKLWSNYGVSKNSWPNSPPFFQTDLSQLLNSTTAYSPNENTTTIGGLMEVMLEMVDLNEVADKMIVSAYKSILSRFPHYKSAYQLMQFYASEKKYAKAVDLMFTSIFSWSWTKKKISSGDSIFEQFTEIRRSDFERSKSSDYHIARIINSLAELLEKTQDAKRLAFVTHSLLVVNKPDDELISNECASRLILMCLKRLTRLIYSLMQRPNATLLKQLPLLLVINRNLHDNSFKGKHVKNLCSIIVVLQKQEEQRVAAERQARSTQQFRLASQTTALQTQQRLQTLFGQPNAQGIPPNVNMTQLYNRAQQVATQHGLSLESLVAQIETDIENGDATREQMYSFIRDS